MMEALGSDASSKSTKASLRNIRNEIFQVPGFQHLNWLMVSHTGKKRSHFLRGGDVNLNPFNEAKC